VPGAGLHGAPVASGADLAAAIAAARLEIVRAPAPSIEAIAAMIAGESPGAACAGEVKQEIFQFQFDNARVRF
jgi:hypothetical protein